MRFDFTGHVKDLVELPAGSICIIRLPEISTVWAVKVFVKYEQGETEKLLVFRSSQDSERRELKPQLVDIEADLLSLRVLDVTSEVVFSPVFDLESTLQDLPLINERLGMVIAVRDQILLCVPTQQDDSYGNVAYLNVSSGELSYSIGGTRQSETLLLDMGMYYITRRWRLLSNDRNRVLLESFKS